MFRLIIALGVAAVLLPAETITKSNTAETAKVSTYDTFSAAQSLYTDVTSFCNRNEEACITGKAIVASAVHTIKGSINQITQEPDQTGLLDTIKTSSVKK